jgi:hypothetical protein
MLCSRRGFVYLMPFGLVFLDDDGDVWTVDIRPAQSEQGHRALLFSRPSFIEPAEQRALEEVPPCWPDCTSDELRGYLAVALERSGE